MWVKKLSLNLNTGQPAEAELVAQCLQGDRQSFRLLVERHQSLVCALTFNACGNVGVSEDLAQESFIAAWRHLPALHDPAKFKTWLCGITRNRIHNDLRQEARRGVEVPLALISIVTAGLCAFRCLRGSEWNKKAIFSAWAIIAFVVTTAANWHWDEWLASGALNPAWTHARMNFVLAFYFGGCALSWWNAFRKSELASQAAVTNPLPR